MSESQQEVADSLMDLVRKITAEDLRQLVTHETRQHVLTGADKFSRLIFDIQLRRNQYVQRYGEDEVVKLEGVLRELLTFSLTSLVWMDEVINIREKTNAAEELRAKEKETDNASETGSAGPAAAVGPTAS